MGLNIGPEIQNLDTNWGQLKSHTSNAASKTNQSRLLLLMINSHSIVPQVT